ncbi:MAG: hypothetical protein ACREOA_07010 [Candidatus Dormibacteria bacterium]
MKYWVGVEISLYEDKAGYRVEVKVPSGQTWEIKYTPHPRATTEEMQRDIERKVVADFMAGKLGPRTAG